MPQKRKKDKIRASQKKQQIGNTREPVVLDEVSYTKKDLKRTIVLTLFILFLEFFVFYATLNHIIKF